MERNDCLLIISLTSDNLQDSKYYGTTISVQKLARKSDKMKNQRKVRHLQPSHLSHVQNIADYVLIKQ